MKLWLPVSIGALPMFLLATGALAADPPPAPTNLRIENAVNPLPTDLITIPRVLRWDAVADPTAGYTVTLLLPPRDPAPGFAEPQPVPVATVAAGQPLEYRFETAPWRGPYCLRVVADYPSGEHHASEPACVAKERDGGPYDPPMPAIAINAIHRGFVITWPSPFYHGFYSVQRAEKPSGSESVPESAWGYSSRSIGEDSPGHYQFGDLGFEVGKVYCYRVRPNLEDGRWSPPACLLGTPSDEPEPDRPPLPPEVGNSPLQVVNRFRDDLLLGGALLVLAALANWWAFRGYR
jgi:hypothetical protein